MKHNDEALECGYCGDKLEYADAGDYTDTYGYICEDCWDYLYTPEGREREKKRQGKEGYGLNE